jgi:hypothetical protein
MPPRILLFASKTCHGTISFFQNQILDLLRQSLDYIPSLPSPVRASTLVSRRKVILSQHRVLPRIPGSPELVGAQPSLDALLRHSPLLSSFVVIGSLPPSFPLTDFRAFNSKKQRLPLVGYFFNPLPLSRCRFHLLLR